jgi:hypothetical protein
MDTTIATERRTGAEKGAGPGEQQSVPEVREEHIINALINALIDALEKRER